MVPLESGTWLAEAIELLEDLYANRPEWFEVKRGHKPAEIMWALKGGA